MNQCQHFLNLVDILLLGKLKVHQFIIYFKGFLEVYIIYGLHL